MDLVRRVEIKYMRNTTKKCRANKNLDCVRKFPQQPHGDRRAKGRILNQSPGTNVLILTAALMNYDLYGRPMLLAWKVPARETAPNCLV